MPIARNLPTTFVLVPGGFHGGWAYSRVARLLRAAGHDVHTPTLTGLGERSHLLRDDVDLETHILDVVNLILWEDLSDVVLGGHSYGGMVITAVADRLPERIASLVYIDAVIPADGDSALDRTPAIAREAVEAAVAANGGALVPPFPAAMWVKPEDQVWVDAKTTPQPLASLTQAVALSGAYRDVPRRVFVYAAGGAEQERYRAFESLPGCLVRGIEDTGHDIMVDQPAALAAALVETATRRGVPPAGSSRS